MLFRELVDKLDLSELHKIKRDLETGGVHIKRLIDFKIKEKEGMEVKYCANCGAAIDPFSGTNCTVVFGGEVKKKAHFCAYDCMKYFMDNMKKIKEDK